MSNPVKFGSQFKVNKTSAELQYDPSITHLANGRFLIAWTDTTNYLGENFTQAADVRFQIFNADGSRSGAVKTANTTLAQNQNFSATTELKNGGFVMAWEDASGKLGESDAGIKAQLFSSTGAKVGSEFRVNTTTTGGQERPELATLTNGNFIAVWEDDSGKAPDTDSGAIRGQLFKANGSKSGSEFVVNTVTASNQEMQSVTSLAGGGFAVEWTSYNDTIGAFQTKAQIYTAGGVRSGSEIFIEGAPLDPGSYGSITGLKNGNVAVISNVGQEDITLKIYSAGGQQIGGSTVVNDLSTVDNIHSTDTTLLADGRIVVVWEQTNETSIGSGVYQDSIRARVMNANGTASSGEFIVNTSVDNTSVPVVEALKDGRFVVTWRWDNQNDGYDPEVRAQIFDPRTAGVTIKGTAIGDDLVGTGFADTFRGFSGDDKLSGRGGADFLFGGRGKDALSGGEGKDTFVFNTALNKTTNVDKILDFASEDVIQLDHHFMTKLIGRGTLTDGQFFKSASATEAHDPGDRIIYNTTTGALYYDADGNKNNGVDAVKFAVLTGSPNDITHSDFFIL